MQDLCIMMGHMKHLTDADIAQMAATEFTPDTRATNRAVRADLHLGQLIPPSPAPTPKCARLDLHTLTEEQAWRAIMELVSSGVRRAVIITGASGILHKKFPTWATESILAPHIISWAPINNGSFSVTFRRTKNV